MLKKGWSISSRATAKFNEITDVKDQYTPESWAVLEAWMTENEGTLAEADSRKM